MRITQKFTHGIDIATVSYCETVNSTSYILFKEIKVILNNPRSISLIDILSITEPFPMKKLLRLNTDLAHICFI